MPPLSTQNPICRLLTPPNKTLQSPKRDLKMKHCFIKESRKCSQQMSYTCVKESYIRVHELFSFILWRNSMMRSVSSRLRITKDSLNGCWVWIWCKSCAKTFIVAVNYFRTDLSNKDRLGLYLSHWQKLREENWVLCTCTNLTGSFHQTSSAPWNLMLLN